MVELAEEPPNDFGGVRSSHLIWPRVPVQFHAVMLDSHVPTAIAVNHVFNVHVVVRNPFLAVRSHRPVFNQSRDTAHRANPFVFSVLPIPIVVVIDRRFNFPWMCITATSLYR